jgi:hypothetical protein
MIFHATQDGRYAGDSGTVRDLLWRDSGCRRLAIVALGVGVRFSLRVGMEPLEKTCGWGREPIARANFYG